MRDQDNDHRNAECVEDRHIVHEGHNDCETQVELGRCFPLNMSFKLTRGKLGHLEDEDVGRREPEPVAYGANKQEHHSDQVH